MDPQRKARRTTPRRDYNFHESLSPTLPLAPSPAITSRLPVGYILAALWVIAAVVLGIAAGLMIVRANQSAAPSAPFPVAQTSLKVTSAAAASTATIKPAAPVSQPALKVAPASSVNQASAGTPLKVASDTFMQPAAGAAALQPGYAPYTSSIQGEVGTAAVPMR